MNIANIINGYETCLQCPTEILGFFDELHQEILQEKTRSAKNDEILYLLDKIFGSYDITNAKGKLTQVVNLSKANKLTFNQIEYKNFYVAKLIDKLKHNKSLYENKWPGIYEWSQKVQMNNKKQLLLHVPISVYKQGDVVKFSHEVSSFNNIDILYMKGDGRIVYTGQEPVFGVIRVNALPENRQIRVVNQTERDISSLSVNNDEITMLFKKNCVLSFTWGGLCPEKNLKDNLYISCIISISL